MKVLLIGSGGREAAMAQALSRSPKLTELFVSPGADGIAEIASIAPRMNADELVEFAKSKRIELVIFGGETELVEGQADALREAGMLVLGASKSAAALEGSKALLKDVLFAAGVPCAVSRDFTELDEALAYLDGRAMPIVLKTDGLAGGKGVVICETLKDAKNWTSKYLSGEAFGDAGQKLVIEDFITGPEVSFFVLVDSKGNAHPIASARDHKQIFDGDKGPNTGGMGAFTPVPEFSDELQTQIMNEMIAPTLREMEKRGAPYSGFLFAGLMLTPFGPKLLEYNVRLGDPETQVILLNLPVDFLEIAHEAASGALSASNAKKLAKEQNCRTAVNIVLAAKGYPEKPEKGAEISGLGELKSGEDFFHAGTKFDGAWRVNGGRVLNVVGRGEDIEAARKDAYTKVEKIHFDGMQFRKDIGNT